MNRLRLVGAAFKNMMRAAARDPLWAVLALIGMPFRIWKRLLGFMFILIIVTFVIGMGGRYFLEQMGFGRGSVVFFLPDFVTLLALAAITFRFITNTLILNFGDIDHDTHGTARFASDRELAALTSSKSGLLIGRDAQSGKLLRYDGPAHLLTMAPTRTGKGVGTIIPNLLTANRSVICVDPKGENARITGRAREKFGPVHVLDPFGVNGTLSAAFNPLTVLDSQNPDVAEDASTLADALVFDEPGMAGEAHWNEEAKALIAGLLLNIVANDPPARKNLATLREYLTLGPEDFAVLLERMRQSDAADGLIARAANRHRGKSDREAAGVLSAAQRHTHFLDSPRMTAALGRSDFRFADLKQSRATVFLVLPPDRLSSYSRWLRLLVAQSLLEMARDPAKPEKPVLYLLDEFASLGHLAPVERAMALMAGYGVQLWPILQDIHQLRATYRRGAGTFLSNAGVLQVFGINDHDSSRLISDLLGQETVVFQTMARTLDSEKTGISLSQHHTARSLLTPDEVRNLPAQGQLLFVAGQRPVFAKKLIYFTDPEFRDMFDEA